MFVTAESGHNKGEAKKLLPISAPVNANNTTDCQDVKRRILRRKKKISSVLNRGFGGPLIWPIIRLITTRRKLLRGRRKEEEREGATGFY